VTLAQFGRAARLFIRGYKVGLDLVG
jgi:hypothetical protein